MIRTGIFSWFSYPLPLRERLSLIKRAGFDATSLWWGDEDDECKNSQPDIARELGLDIDYVHASCDDPDCLWLDGIDGEDYLNMLISCVDDCSRHGIPTVVIHITRLTSKPAVSQIGLGRMGRLLDWAEKRQVNLAIENMNDTEHLDYVFANLPSDRIGFCYDSGHEHCSHPDADCLSRYGNKLFAVHLDDNWGDDDTHLLPGDGSISWDITMEKLKKCRDIPFLTLEVDFNRNHEKSARYFAMSAEEYLSLAHARLSQLQKRFLNISKRER